MCEFSNFVIFHSFHSSLCEFSNKLICMRKVTFQREILIYCSELLENHIRYCFVNIFVFAYDKSPEQCFLYYMFADNTSKKLSNVKVDLNCVCLFVF